MLIADQQTRDLITQASRPASDVSAEPGNEQGLADTLLANDQDQVFGLQAASRVRIELRKAGGNGLRGRRVYLGQPPLEYLETRLCRWAPGDSLARVRSLSLHPAVLERASL